MFYCYTYSENTDRRRKLYWASRYHNVNFDSMLKSNLLWWDLVMYLRFFLDNLELYWLPTILKETPDTVIYRSVWEKCLKVTLRPGYVLTIGALWQRLALGNTESNRAILTSKCQYWCKPPIACLRAKKPHFPLLRSTTRHNCGQKIKDFALAGFCNWFDKKEILQCIWRLK